MLFKAVCLARWRAIAGRYDELDVMEHYVILQRMAAERFAEAKAA
jgi:hypothetical protein